MSIEISETVVQCDRPVTGKHILDISNEGDLVKINKISTESKNINEEIKKL